MSAQCAGECIFDLLRTKTTTMIWRIFESVYMVQTRFLVSLIISGAAVTIWSFLSVTAGGQNGDI